MKDTDHWLASPKREEFFGPLGVTNIRMFVDPENRTRVGVMMDAPDMDAPWWPLWKRRARPTRWSTTAYSPKRS